MEALTLEEACVALNMIPQVGPVRIRNLLARFGSPQEILSARGTDLRETPGMTRESVDAITSWKEQIDLEAELAAITAFGAHILTWESPEYPASLRQIHNPPFLLYVWGTIAESDRHAVGVVGSRKTSTYGIECAKKLSYQLAYAGLTVVSGLARGIDTAAHQGALAAKGRTIAVIGSGLGKLYPPENQGLAERIAESGAVVSEYPMNRPPDTQTFPYRNRIVAGWGNSLLVVEAGLNSGALITANQAIEQGRNVYAVPGQIDRPTAHGSNRLIQQGAKLVMSAADILDDLNALFPEIPEPKAPVLPANLNEVETKIFEAIDENETPIDRIISLSGLTAAAVSSSLLSLEMKRLVKQLPGQRFVKLR